MYSVLAEGGNDQYRYMSTSLWHRVEVLRCIQLECKGFSFPILYTIYQWIIIHTITVLIKRKMSYLCVASGSWKHTICEGKFIIIIKKIITSLTFMIIILVIITIELCRSSFIASIVQVTFVYFSYNCV